MQASRRYFVTRTSSKTVSTVHDTQVLSLIRFVIRTLESVAVNDYVIAESRTSNCSKFNTTQVFMLPTGDWTKQVYNAVVAQPSEEIYGLRALLSLHIPFQAISIIW